MRHDSPRRRWLATALALLSLTAPAAAPSTAAPEPPSPSADAGDKVDTTLSRRLDDGATADFLISFEQRADLTAAAAVDDWAERGAAVVDALRRTADRSQRAVRRQLDAAGVEYRAFHASNVIYVVDGTAELATRLAGRAEVAEIEPARTYALPEPRQDVAPLAATTAAVEWGVADIRADDVWADFGTKGENVVVASIDTGVEFDHPALVGQYRGTNGDGTFDHDHNWYDPAKICAGSTPQPCDNNGHGTHVTGTMTGTGEGAQIGVAPGARWIAAKGCESDGCTDFSLLASGEWMLAPTDVDGDDPRPDLRPHIVNNSWGGGTTARWYDDLVEAWVAAGIFPAFANGNSGPSCGSAENPGNGAGTYSAGMYDMDHVIDPQSSRGPGYQGETKPDIAAPGVQIRSSLPGDTYASWSGTSMATPHVSGAVALLWSSSPIVLGDVEATRTLLDEKAIDTDDTSCGGTPENNNVFGEGRLDVYAAVEAAPRGDTGVLRGTVTDATGAGLGGVTVAVAGPANRRLGTAPDGTWSVQVPVGDYDVTASLFGHDDGAGSAAVRTGETTTLDLTLTPRPTATLTGTVTEGSDHGWPLYATITVDGVPDGTYYTNPVDGSYAIDLPAGDSYDVTVEAAAAGLTPSTTTVDLAGATTHDVALAADEYACTAPGYEQRDRVVTYTETFDPDTAPPGWSVADHVGNGQVWRFPHDDWNRTGGEGNFASVFSALYGPDGRQDTDLVSPVIDLTGVDVPALWFKTDYSSDADIGVDLSVDGGATWATVWSHSGSEGIYEEEVQVPIPAAAGQPDVRVRFTFASAFNGWWQVDDVVLGRRDCATVDGGLLTGHVVDANTETPIVGATVTGAADPALTVSTVATPDDPGLGDGFFWTFVPGPGEQAFTGARTRYSDTTVVVDVAADTVTPVEFALPAGRLDIREDRVDGAVVLGGTATATVTVANDGSAPATLDLTERPGVSAPAAAGAGAPVQRVSGTFTAGPEVAGGTGTAGTAPAGEPIAPWALLADYPSPIWDSAVDVLDGRVYSVGGGTGSGATNAAYVHDGDGEWEAIAPLPRARQRPMGGFLHGRFYAAGGWSSTGATRVDVDVYDPRTDTWSPGPAMPKAVTSAGWAVMDDMLYVVGGCPGDCGSAEVLRLDAAAGQWERVADYPEETALVSCGAIDHKLYCAGGARGESLRELTSAYVYDPAGDTWTELAELPTGLWGSAYAAADGKLIVSGGVTDRNSAITNEGFAYDPATDTWAPIPNAPQAVYRAGSACGFHTVGGSTGPGTTSATAVLPGWANCGSGDAVGWLAADPPALTLAPGASARVTLTFDASALEQPGAVSAALVLRDDTPYDAAAVPVHLTVSAPSTWGRLTGTVLGRSCAGTTTPLPGVVVQLDGATGSRTLVSGADGRYATWFDTAANPVGAVVVKSGYQPQTAELRVRPGRDTVRDFTLRQTGCGR
ncbi:peptidase S8 [Jiangella ureilytica]|uniref:Peptidase S8 n=1 Tax=Jiangella ureilytica TaxID=2530374 RepID=A0A4R4RP84_9ACTN|nr:S8 family serine peptidase [Jiangella ureilytica]TDC51651.1 peptidase S8 [Jiangella ureilytica]